MKKSLLGLLFVLAVNVGFAQTVFDAFENQDDVAATIVNKKMFSLLDKMEAQDAVSQQYLNLIKKLDDLKVFVTENAKKAAEMKAVSGKYVQSALLEELKRGNDNGKNVTIYVKPGANNSQIKELLMFIEGSGKGETVLMSLTGNFSLSELPVLIDRMKLPGGEELKKASKI